MLRQRLNEKFAWSSHVNTPPTSYNLKEDKPLLSEWKLALYGLVVSLLVITTKVYYANREIIQKAILEPRLVTFEVLSEEGEVMLTHAWKTAVKYSRFWLPALCGFLTAYFTWVMVYLDSNVPGVQPPSPLSPKKYKDQSGHSFHLNYIFAIALGIFVFCYMSWKDVSITY